MTCSVVNLWNFFRIPFHKDTSGGLLLVWVVSKSVLLIQMLISFTSPHNKCHIFGENHTNLVCNLDFFYDFLSGCQKVRLCSWKTDIWDHCERFLICLNSIFDELKQFGKHNDFLQCLEFLIQYWHIHCHTLWKEIMLLCYILNFLSNIK